MTSFHKKPRSVEDISSDSSESLEPFSKLYLKSALLIKTVNLIPRHRFTPAGEIAKGMQGRKYFSLDRLLDIVSTCRAKDLDPVL